MKTFLKEELQKYILLIRFILLTICVTLLIFNSTSLLHQPLSLSKDFSDIAAVNEDSSGDFYIIDDSGAAIDIVKNNTFRFSIAGSDPDKTFDTAREVCSDDKGNLYILEKIVNADGKHIDEERVLAFSGKGSRRGIIYDYTPSDPTMTTSLSGLTYADGKIQFTLAANKTLQIFSADPSTLQVSQGKILDSGIESSAIWDTQIFGDKVWYSTKYGLIEETASGAAPVTLYDGSEHNSSSYCSIPYKLSCDSTGKIYFCDLGLRTIQSIGTDGTLTTEVDSRNIPKGIDSDDGFENLPLLSELNVTPDGQLSFVSTESGYDENGENYYLYRIGVADSGSFTLFSSYPKSILIHLQNIFCLLLAAAAVCLAVANILALKKKKLKIEIADNMKAQLPIIVVSLAIAIVVCVAVLQQSNKSYIDLYQKDLNNIAAYITSYLSRDDVDALTEPKDYKSSAYIAINSQVTSILNNAVDDPRIYCVLYKVSGNVVQAFYSDDLNYGVAYPMPGSYQGSAEQSIISTKEPLTIDSQSTSEGSYMYVDYPVSDDTGQVYALAEIGLDLTSVQEDATELFNRTVMSVILYTVLLLLLYSEVSNIQTLMKGPKDKSLPREYPARKIRPIIFILCFATSLPTAFIPVMGANFWNNTMPFSSEIAAAIPVSAEMFAVAVVNLFFGRTIEKVGTRKICIFGAIMMSGANIVYGIAPNLWIFTLGALLNGAAGGMLLLAISAYIMSYSDEAQVSEGFIHYNAAYLSGLNIGIIAGSLIAESFSYSVSFFFGAAILLLIILFIPACIDPAHKGIAQEKQAPGVLKKELISFFKDPSILKFYFLLMVPYMFCASFGNYVFPLFGADQGLNTTQISMAFMLAGCVSIYLGETLSKLTAAYLSVKRTLVVAGITNCAALGIFCAYPSIPSAFIAVFLFALADSYGLTALSVAYSNIKSTERIGEGTSAGIYNMFENISEMIGPLLFALALQVGTQLGIFIILAIYGGLLAVFALTMKGEEV